jgi:hypothetical protein
MCERQLQNYKNEQFLHKLNYFRENCRKNRKCLVIWRKKISPKETKCRIFVKMKMHFGVTTLVQLVYVIALFIPEWRGGFPVKTVQGSLSQMTIQESVTSALATTPF